MPTWLVISLASLVAAAGCATFDADPRGEFWNLAKCDHAKNRAFCESRARPWRQL